MAKFMNKRIVEIGSRRFTYVNVLDQPGAGGACHEYEVVPVVDDLGTPYVRVSFQDGPVKENGVNGCHNEDLLAIVIHRLQSFQAGDFACAENKLALDKLLEAMFWLNHRTTQRQKRGVEGTNQL